MYFVIFVFSGLIYLFFLLVISGKYFNLFYVLIKNSEIVREVIFILMFEF